MLRGLGKFRVLKIMKTAKPSKLGKLLKSIFCSKKIKNFEISMTF